MHLTALLSAVRAHLSRVQTQKPQYDNGQVCTSPRVMSGFYSVHCTLYSVQCTLYSVQCTLYSVQYRVYCTLFNVQSSAYNLQFKLYSVHSSLYIVEYVVMYTLSTL